MKICTNIERNELLKLLENRSKELSIIQKVLSEPHVISRINTDEAIIYDRIIGELLAEHIDDDAIIGTAFILGMMQGEVLAQKKNSDQRTTANRSI